MEGREKEGEKHQWVVASHAPPTRDLANNPGMCPDWELNLRPFGLQAGAQPTRDHTSWLVQSHHPGPSISFFFFPLRHFICTYVLHP